MDVQAFRDRQFENGQERLSLWHNVRAYVHGKLLAKKFYLKQELPYLEIDKKDPGKVIVYKPEKSRLDRYTVVGYTPTPTTLGRVIRASTKALDVPDHLIRDIVQEVKGMFTIGEVQEAHTPEDFIKMYNDYHTTCCSYFTPTKGSRDFYISAARQGLHRTGMMAHIPDMYGLWYADAHGRPQARTIVYRRGKTWHHSVLYGPQKNMLMPELRKRKLETPLPLSLNGKDREPYEITPVKFRKSWYVPVCPIDYITDIRMKYSPSKNTVLVSCRDGTVVNKYCNLVDVKNLATY